MGSGRRLKVHAGAICVALALASAPAPAATITAQANASVVKPLILTKVQDFELGSIVLKNGIYSNAIVSLSRTGAFSCSSNLICTGAVRFAQYNVSGTNNRTVLISAPNVTMVNQSDPTKTLTLVVDKPASVFLTNSGPPGTNFNLGGSLAVSSTTAGGDYVGTFNVTVDYQ